MEKKMPPFDELVRMRIVLSVPGMDAVDVRRDLVYKDADGEPLHMDVYSPPGPPRPRPALLLVHGGPLPKLGAKNMGVFRSYGELLAASGLVAVAFDHRFLAPGRIGDAAGDVADLIAHVRHNAAALGIDPERLAVWAFSGGGPFLAAPLRERFSAIRGLGEDARSAPPILVGRAGLDHPWLNAGTDRFVQEAVARGATLDLLNHPDGRHGFDILDDDARTRQIIRRTLDFLKDQLGA